jgi:hypothetical protein
MSCFGRILHEKERRKKKPAKKADEPREKKAQDDYRREKLGDLGERTFLTAADRAMIRHLRKR